MVTDLPPLPWLRAFESSARLGSFTRAGQELGLTPSAISYQVRGLEAELGHKLFLRQGRALVLTRLGQAYLPVVTRAFGDLAATTSGLFGRGAQPTVTLRCVTSLNLLWLVPRIARFHARHPQARLRLLSASWSEVGQDETIDIDIRYGDGTWADGEVLPLMQDPVIAVCAPDLRGAGTMTGLEQRLLRTRAPLIELTGVVDTWAHFLARHAPGAEVPEPVHMVDQSLIALDMAARGMGYALVAEVFARPYLERGDLVLAVPQSLPARQGHFMVLPWGRNRGAPGMAALIDWLREEARGGT